MAGVIVFKLPMPIFAFAKNFILYNNERNTIQGSAKRSHAGRNAQG